MSLPVLSVASRIMQEEVGAVFYYPVWWYSAGLMKLVHWIREGLQYRWRKYALWLWITHLATPMYGQYSLWGRVVSFLMRVVVVTGRSIAWLLEVAVYVLMVLVWLALPIAAVLGCITAWVTLSPSSLMAW